MAQRALVSEEMDDAQELSALTGASAGVELDGLNLREKPPVFMLRSRAPSPISTTMFGSRPRPAVRP